MRKKMIKVGFDLDGVILYNPIRIFRALVSDIFKAKIKKTKDRKFFIPQAEPTKFIWKILHKTSFMANPGLEDIKKLSKNNGFRFYLITGRYGFLKDDFEDWLKRIKSNEIFYKVFLNADNLQPPEFKSSMIRKLKLDAYVEDNFDIVKELNKNTKVKVLWMTNIVDKKISYPLKFLSLKEVCQFLKTLA